MKTGPYKTGRHDLGRGRGPAPWRDYGSSGIATTDLNNLGLRSRYLGYANSKPLSTNSNTPANGELDVRILVVGLRAFELEFEPR